MSRIVEPSFLERGKMRRELRAVIAARYAQRGLAPGFSQGLFLPFLIEREPFLVERELRTEWRRRFPPSVNYGHQSRFLGLPRMP